MSITYADPRIKLGKVKRHSQNGHISEMEVDGKWVQVCEECEKPMPIYPEAPRGFVSPNSQEVIIGSAGDKTGLEAVPKNVCKECYRIDHKKVYGEEVSCQI